jgi:uncharacterized protein (DUF433 family)
MLPHADHAIVDRAKICDYLLSVVHPVGRFKARVFITINPEVCHGKPTIRGLGYPVDMVLDLLSAGMSTAEILADYPDLEAADITAVLQYAAQLARVQRVEILPA